MSECSDIPTQTLFGSSTTDVLTTETTTTVETSNLPDRTTTFVVTTSSCGPGGSTTGTGGISGVPTCTPVTITSTSVIDGGATTIVSTKQIVHTTNTVVTFPTQTLFAHSCRTTQPAPTSRTQTPTSSTNPITTSTSKPPATNNNGYTSSSSSTTYFLSTPPPTTYLANTSITSGGSVITSQVLVSSQPPPTTVYSLPTWRSNGKGSDASASMIGGVVGGVLGSLVVAGVALYLWRRKKHRREKEEREYENQVRKEFGRRLELEFEDDGPGNGQDPHRRRLSAVDLFYSADPLAHGPAERPTSMAESAPMLIAGAPNHHRRRSSSSTSPNKLNNRMSSVSTSHSLHPHLLLPTNDNFSYNAPPVPTSSESRRNTTHDRSSSRRQSSAHSSAGSYTLYPRPQSSRISSDLLINLQTPVESAAEHSTNPSTNASSSTIPPSQPNRMSSAHAPAGSSASQLPSSSNPGGDKDDYAVSRHRHNRSSSRSSIVSALMAVAPLQQLKIANRTQLDELDDEDEDETKV